MKITEAHFWLIIALSFLIAVLIVISNDFGKETEFEERIEKIEQQLKKLDSSQISKKGSGS